MPTANGQPAVNLEAIEETVKYMTDVKRFDTVEPWTLEIDADGYIAVVLVGTRDGAPGKFSLPV